MSFFFSLDDLGPYTQVPGAYSCAQKSLLVVLELPICVLGKLWLTTYKASDFPKEKEQAG